MSLVSLGSGVQSTKASVAGGSAGRRFVASIPVAEPVPAVRFLIPGAGAVAQGATPPPLPSVFQCVPKGPPCSPRSRAPPLLTTWQVFRCFCCLFFFLFMSNFALLEFKSITSALESYLSTYKYYLMVQSRYNEMTQGKF